MKLFRHVVVIFLTILSGLTARAQANLAISIGPILSPFGTIAANAPYRVCLSTSTGIPCSTAGVTIYSDPALTHPIPQPAAANSQGIINVFVGPTAPGSYIIQVNPLPNITYTYYEITPGVFSLLGGVTGSIPYQSAPNTTTFLPPNTTTTREFLIEQGTGTAGAAPFLDLILSGDLITALTTPPAIGGTTPSTGNFTTLNSTGGALNGTIGGSTPAAGSFTTVQSSTPIGIASGGTGTNTVPLAAQILVSQNSGAYAPKTLQSDCTLDQSANITCANFNHAVAITGTLSNGSGQPPSFPATTPVGNQGVSANQLNAGTLPSSFTSQNYVQLPVLAGTIDICTAIAAAIASLPSTGGTIDARGLSGLSPIACASNPFAANNAAGSPKAVTLLLGPGIINTTQPWLISTNNVNIRGAGRTQTVINYTGTTNLVSPTGGSGGIVEWASATPATTTIEGIGLYDLFISGNSHSPYGLLLDGTHKNDIERVSVWNVSDTGMEIKFAVTNNFVAPHVTGADAAIIPGIGETLRPNHGLVLDGTLTTGLATASSITNPVFEFLNGCGIFLGLSFNNVFVAGTSEGNGTANVCSTTTGGQYPSTTIFIGTDFESATSGQSVNLYGFWNQLIGVAASQNVDIYGTKNIIQGGTVVGALTVHSGAVQTVLNDVTFGTLSDSGTDTEIRRLRGANPNTYPGDPDQERSTSWHGVVNAIGTVYDGSDMVTGQFTFPYNTAVPLSKTDLSATTNWHAILMGQWINSANGTGMAQLAPFIEVSNANPTVNVGSCLVQFSITGGLFSGKELTCTTSTTVFNGRVIVIPGTNNASSGSGIWTLDNITAGSLSINSSQLLSNGQSFTNGAGSGAGTLTNAPTAGNPTKWIPINDNGTIRYIPSW